MCITKTLYVVWSRLDASGSGAYLHVGCANAAGMGELNVVWYVEVMRYSALAQSFLVGSKGGRQDGLGR